MATAVKMTVRESFLAQAAQDGATVDDVIVSLMADLQQIQDNETRVVLQDVKLKVGTFPFFSLFLDSLSNTDQTIFAFSDSARAVCL